MDKTLRALSVRLSAALFFVMALAGWLNGHDPAVCAYRAFIGAIVLYAVVRIAGNLAVRILLDAMVQDQSRRQKKHR